MNNELQQRIARIQEICGAWGLYEPSNSSAIKQALKATSEIGELADAVLKNDIDDIKDAIGDIFVCWVNYTKLGLEPMGFVGQECSYSTTEETILNIFGDVPNPPYLEFVAIHYNLTLLECIDSAIEVISKRKGVISNGAFVKDE